MKVSDIISEESFGTHPKRPRRKSDRHERGHTPKPTFNTIKGPIGGDTLGVDLDDNYDIEDEVVDENKASRKLCLSRIPDEDLGASNLSSCKAQGLRARDGNKSHLIGNKRIKVGGKRIKSAKYGGPLPDYS